MASAKDISVRPIYAQAAAKVIKAVHYSGKVVNNSQLHLGVFLNGRLEGAMQFGPSMDKARMLGLVAGTAWNGFLELNRMAFSDVLPRNSESRAIAVAMRIIKKNYPHIEWVVSFSDGTQCGDGTIYRASGFVLTGIKENTQIWSAPSGGSVSRMSMTKGGNNNATGAASMKAYKAVGFVPLKGFQLRYVYFLNKSARDRLTVPALPFSRIDEMGAGMYKGKARVKQATTDDQSAGRRGGTDPHAPQEAGNGRS
jgi:hypothetical protein